MGGRTAPCPLDIPNNTLKVYWEDPISMTYGAEAVIPLENGFPTMRTSIFTSDGNSELLKKNLDLIEEGQENAMVQLAYY